LYHFRSFLFPPERYNCSGPSRKKSATIPIIFRFMKGETMWRCTVCGYEYDEAKEGTPFEKLPDDWTCPVCNAPKSEFEKVR
jgi:rubredoxin